MEDCSLKVEIISHIERKGGKPCVVTMHYPPVVAKSMDDAMAKFFSENAPPRPSSCTTISFNFIQQNQKNG